MIKDAEMDPPELAIKQQLRTAKMATTYSYMDVAFFSGLNRNAYGNLMNKLQNAFWMGINEYPRDLNLEYNLEINWRGDSMPEVRSPNNRAAFYTKKEVET